MTDSADFETEKKLIQSNLRQRSASSKSCRRACNRSSQGCPRWWFQKEMAEAKICFYNVRNVDQKPRGSWRNPCIRSNGSWLINIPHSQPSMSYGNWQALTAAEPHSLLLTTYRKRRKCFFRGRKTISGHILSVGHHVPSI